MSTAAISFTGNGSSSSTLMFNSVMKMAMKKKVYILSETTKVKKLHKYVLNRTNIFQICFRYCLDMYQLLLVQMQQPLQSYNACEHTSLYQRDYAPESSELMSSFIQHDIVGV